MSAPDKAPVAALVIVKSDTWNWMVGRINEWDNLIVQMTSSAVPLLTKGEAQSILEIPDSSGSGGGGSGTGGDFPLKVKAMTGGASVFVVTGKISFVTMPTIGGVSIGSTPPPTIPITSSGFLVLKPTWYDDDLPRCVPEGCEIVFESGDPSESYIPPVEDSPTASSLPFACIWYGDEGIEKIVNANSGNITIERQVYADGSAYYIAFKS